MSGDGSLVVRKRKSIPNPADLEMTAGPHRETVAISSGTPKDLEGQDLGKPKNSLSSFSLWLAANRKALVDSAGANYRKIVSSMASTMWKDMRPEDRSFWDAKAKGLKVEYEKHNKSSEKQHNKSTSSLRMKGGPRRTSMTWPRCQIVPFWLSSHVALQLIRRNAERVRVALQPCR